MRKHNVDSFFLFVLICVCLVSFYNDYYQQYLRKADYPRLMVRFEDMLLMPHAVLKAISDCAGVEMTSQISFQTTSSKGHGSKTNFVHAIAKTGNAARRTQLMTADDLELARTVLDSDILETFQYQLPSLYSR